MPGFTTIFLIWTVISLPFFLWFGITSIREGETEKDKEHLWLKIMGVILQLAIWWGIGGVLFAVIIVEPGYHLYEAVKDGIDDAIWKTRYEGLNLLPFAGILGAFIVATVLSVIFIPKLIKKDEEGLTK